MSSSDCTLKRCSKCGLSQPLHCFNRSKATRDGLQAWCKVCSRISVKESYARNKDKSDQRNKQYRSVNKEKVAEWQRRWREENPEKKRAQKMRHRARVANAEGSHTQADIQQMYADQNGLCAYCAKELNGDFHVDHMQPLFKGGSNDWTNLAISCKSCNLRKGTQTVREFMGYLWGA